MYIRFRFRLCLAHCLLNKSVNVLHAFLLSVFFYVRFSPRHIGYFI